MRWRLVWAIKQVSWVSITRKNDQIRCCHYLSCTICQEDKCTFKRIPYMTVWWPPQYGTHFWYVHCHFYSIINLVFWFKSVVSCSVLQRFPQLLSKRVGCWVKSKVNIYSMLSSEKCLHISAFGRLSMWKSDLKGLLLQHEQASLAAVKSLALFGFDIYVIFCHI